MNENLKRNCGSTGSLWPMIPGDDFQNEYTHDLLQTWNDRYPEDRHDTITSLYESKIVFHIDEIILVWFLSLRDDLIPSVWNQVILWHKFNVRLLLSSENQSKGRKVDQAKVERITETVKAFYRNPGNQHYALNVVKCNIGTTKMIQDEDNEDNYIAVLIDDWKQWYNNLTKEYDYDEDIIKVTK